MTGSTRRYSAASFFARRYRVFLGLHWMLTLALAAVLLGAFPAGRTEIRGVPHQPHTACPKGQVLMHMYSSAYPSGISTCLFFRQAPKAPSPNGA